MAKELCDLKLEQVETLLLLDQDPHNTYLTSRLLNINANYQEIAQKDFGFGRELSKTG